MALSDFTGCNPNNVKKLNAITYSGRLKDGEHMCFFFFILP